nr:putative xaa-pro aminopeptidase pepp [Quercus suber]
MSKPIANPNLPAPPAGKYPAKDHARRVAKWIADHDGPTKGVLYLEGTAERLVEVSRAISSPFLFFLPWAGREGGGIFWAIVKWKAEMSRVCPQRRHFFYLTGCDLPDCYYAYDIAADRSTLWIPPVDPESVMWAGMPLLPDQALQKFDVDHVLTTDELKSGNSLAGMLKEPGSTVLVIKDRAYLAVFETGTVRTLAPNIDFDWTRKAIEACRVVKDAFEISLIRHANIVSSYAHEQILANVTRAKNERELNAVFVMHCHANGCREQAYGCICAAGTNASTLHYVHNDQPLHDRLNLLIDAGAEYSCYCSDITRSFPLNGTFTKESREIYDLVLRMQSECMSMIRAGVLWEDVHMKAHTIAAQGLRELGILEKSLSVERILFSKITTRFFPHGLGHYLGMDTHDVGGNADYNDPDEFFRYLRIRGRLPPGSVVTNEPGIYFREFPLKQELADGKWIGVVDQKVLARYWSVGGVRIEDDIHVLEGGYENLTTVPSGREEVQAMVLKGARA